MAHSPGGSPWLCGSPEVKIDSDSFRVGGWVVTVAVCEGYRNPMHDRTGCSVVVESSQLEVLVPVESWPRWCLKLRLRLRLRGVYPDEYTV